MLPKPLEFWSTNYFALVDSQTCTGCGICVERCQVNAMSLDDGLNISKVNLDRCIGCGNCVVTCASEAISLVKKKEQVPPLDTEALYDTIMVQKQANLAKSGS
jgi:ferredoxin